MLSGLQKAKALKEAKELRIALDAGGLKPLDKARKLKRAGELRVLLGGEKQGGGVDLSTLKNGDYVRATYVKGDAIMPVGAVVEGTIFSISNFGQSNRYSIDIHTKSFGEKEGEVTARVYSDEVKIEVVVNPAIAAKEKAVADEAAKEAAILAERQVMFDAVGAELISSYNWLKDAENNYTRKVGYIDFFLKKDQFKMRVSAVNHNGSELTKRYESYPALDNQIVSTADVVNAWVDGAVVELSTQLGRLRIFMGIEKAAFNEWVEQYGVTNDMAKALMDASSDRYMLFGLAVHRIKPVIDLVKTDDKSVLSYWSASADVVKSLSQEAFEAVRDQNDHGEKTCFYAYTILRKSKLKSEFDYIATFGQMKNAAREKTQAVGGKLYNMAQKYLGAGGEQSTSDKALPQPSKYRTGQEGSNIELEDDQLHLLGVAEVTDRGSENIYIIKDGLHYYSKVMATERYAIGEWDFAKFPDGKPWDVVFKESADAFGKDVAGYMGAATDNDDPIIDALSKQPLGAWVFFQPYANGYIHILYSLGGGKYGGVSSDDADTLKEAYEKGMAARDKQVAEKATSNPLYQSVIDGAAVTTDLIKQLIAEGKKDPSSAQLKQAVKIIVDKVKVAQ